MGVEPTRDRAERPPSRFEDGETHRGPYTSMSQRHAVLPLLCHAIYWPVKPMCMNAQLFAAHELLHTAIASV